MSSIFKSLIGFFFLILVTVTSVCVIAAAIDNSNARSYHTGIIAELEDSDYSDSVINQLGDASLSQGYELEIVFHHNDGSMTTVSFKKTGSSRANGIRDVAFAEVKLGFDFSFKLLSTTVPHVIKGIAR